MSNKNALVSILPGEIIQDELEAREWAQIDLATITGLTPAIVNELISGKRSISVKYARSLAQAFGTSEELWLNLQNAHDLAVSPPLDETVNRRAKLYAKAPIREMQKRHWIEETNDVNELEEQVCTFFQIKSIDDSVVFAHAARKSDDYKAVSPTQAAWLTRAKNLASAIPVERKYSETLFDKLLSELSGLTEEPEEIRHIPRILASYGIRFLIVEPLPQTKIDGACFWLNSNSPVVALSLRHNRIDNFWQSLIHELTHVKNREGQEQPIIETAMVGTDAQPFMEKPLKEQAADKFAAEFLVNQTEINDFIIRTSPYFSRNKVLGFALRMKVHPGIVVGQLQYKNAIRYANFRPLLVGIQHIITESALTDGWNYVA